MAISTDIDVVLGGLLGRYRDNPRVRDASQNNANILKCVRGGFRMAERHHLAFDPREEYWRLPERRLAVAYLAAQWTGYMAPASCIRELALRVVQTFERSRTDGLVQHRGYEDERVHQVAEVLLGENGRLGTLPGWERIRAVWPKVPATARGLPNRVDVRRTHSTRTDNPVCHTLVQRLEKARAMFGGTDAIQHFRAWRSPEERAGDPVSLRST